MLILQMEISIFFTNFEYGAVAQHHYVVLLLESLANFLLPISFKPARMNRKTTSHEIAIKTTRPKGNIPGIDVSHKASNLKDLLIMF
jgi:hypothetical protein